jgi:Tfp pilus assembly protein PilV
MMPVRNSSRRRRCETGMTVLESLIAVLILGATTSAVVSLVVSGDRIAGRRAGLSAATMLAKNEVERLRVFETSAVLPNDTEYSDVVNGIAYEVSRTRVKGSPLQRAAPGDSVVSFGEYAVSVKRKSGPSQEVSFRLLQGYYDQHR